MNILKFALGMRFDFLKDGYTEDDVSFILGEITKTLSASDVAGLHMYGGLAKIDAADSNGVYTVVFMNGKMKFMRNVYHKLNGDAVLRSYSDSRIPFVQNNVVRNFEGLEFFGVIGEDGSLSGGSGRELSFKAAAEERKSFSQKGSVILAPNSFKGTIPQDEAILHLRRAFRKHCPEKNLIAVPVADGGDGTLKAVESAVFAMRRGMDVTAPYGQTVHAEYLVIDGDKAVIESALASGLAISEGIELDPMKAASTGTGELILRAAHEGVKNIFVCLGGSATNDCGIGLARALGAKFIKGDGEEAKLASEMELVRSVDASGIDPLVKKAKITVVCDVTNPLTGPDGATYTFGPQKGANGETLDALETGMKNMESVLNAYAGRPVCSEQGAGAAGGMGAMLMALFNAEYKAGAGAILDIVEFDEKLRDAAVVITGEGRIDSTTLSGKAVGEVLRRAEAARVPVAIIAGGRGDGAEAVIGKAAFAEFCGPEEDALRHFDEAAERLAEKIAKK
ncbi:MAG: glycerate kinase [Clostridiales bacterium]|nr:glycerate kinase [Clostridiales bacterium]